MSYNLNFETTTIGGHIPFIDTIENRFIRGGLTLDAGHAAANVAESQGQIGVVDGRLTALAGAILAQQGVNGLWQVYTPDSAAVAAALDIGDDTANQAIRLTADTAGAAGNDINIKLTDPEATSSGLSVNVVGNSIEVSLETDGADALVSTAADVVAAINGAAAAAALVTAEVHPDATDGSGVMEAMDDFENLDGGADAVTENIAAANDVVLLMEDVDLSGGNAVSVGYCGGRVIENRLPYMDAVARAAMPHIKILMK